MERRKQGAIDQIAHTALDLFARHGFEATSVETIAAAAGCSPRTFYRYFGTKEDVMFHDLPAGLEEVGAALEEYLAADLGPWDAVTELYAALISRFDATDPEILIQRLDLWLKEPALRVRYTQYVHQAEQVIADCLHRYRGTTPQDDDLPQLIAVAATGAYRATLHTHALGGASPGRDLAKHLREALAAVGDGLADPPVRAVRQRARRNV